MLDNNFINKYKTIPIAKYNSYASGKKKAYIQTPLHKHKEFEIISVTNGRANLIVSGENIVVNKGDIILISPLTPHSIEVEALTPFGHMCLCFDLSIIDNAKLVDAFEQNKIQATFCIKSESEHNKILTEYFSSIGTAITDYEKHWEMNVKGNLQLFFYYIMKNNLYSQAQPHTKDTLFCLKVLKYLEAHYNESINSKSISEVLYYNQSYFCRVFKKNFGTAFCNYLCLFRLSSAKVMLEDSDKSITDIAFDTGFSSVSYFIKCFKKQYGISPNSFRLSNK